MASSSSGTSKGPPPKKGKTSKTKRETHFNRSWTEEFSNIIQKSSKGSMYAYCTVCFCHFSVSHGGRNDVTTHINGKVHKDKSKAVSTSHSVGSYFRPQALHLAIEAETRWSLFIAKHNIPFLASDHATRLFPKMFPDSKIAKSFACGRTKTTAIVKGALAPTFLQATVESMSYPFSVMMDESNDKTDKSCIILVRAFDSQTSEVHTRFLDMPVVNIGTAQNLFEALKSSLSKHGLDLSKAMSFMSDTTNVMKGTRSGVQALIKDEHPQVYDVGCICHLADLAIKAGIKALPVDINQLFIDIFYYFYHSSKRKQQFVDHWCSLFTTEPDIILKHCPTRWLSLLRCVKRYLTQWEGLKSFFSSCEESNSKVRSILERLENPFTKPLLHFLLFILPAMDRFNRMFQTSTENTTSELYQEMSRLVRLYAANFLQASTITDASGNLALLSTAEEDQLPNENLGIGDDTWTCLAELEMEHDITPFLKSVRKFYCLSVQKMLKKFPFGDSLMKDLGVLQPNKVTTYTADVLLKLAKRFPQLNLDEEDTLSLLKEEYLDFTLSPEDVPQAQNYSSVENLQKPKVGKFWKDVSLMMTFDGSPRFPTLCKLMFALMTIPCSNADSERGFSILRKIHTDQRSNLDQSTIVALMSTKFNCDTCCYTVTLTSDLLSKCKKATHAAVITGHSSST